MNDAIGLSLDRDHQLRSQDCPGAESLPEVADSRSTAVSESGLLRWRQAVEVHAKRFHARTLPTGTGLVNTSGAFTLRYFLIEPFGVLDIHETRRARLRVLVDTKYSGKQVALANAIGRQADYISRCLNGTKRIGEEFARIVEHGTGLPPGWLDTPESAPTRLSEPPPPPFDVNVEPVTGSTRAVPLAHAESLRPGEMWLPQYEGVRAMMGDGSDGTNDMVTLVRVSEEGLRWRLIRTSFTSLSNLKLISAYGDSMAGTFEDGDVILVDVGVTAVDRDGVYVYSRDDELLVKRLQREDDGSLTVISDNPRYRDRHIAREDRAIYRVHGRALLAWTARVL